MTGFRHYRAFISYSHSDEAYARWLQRALEGYRLPRQLRRTRADLPARLYPVFRDRDELASGTDLSDSIRRAMDDSEALIVICSPAARASRWVSEEIRRFRSLGRGDRVFCLMVAGSPDPASPECAFPDALLTDDDGNALHEPLAADVTPGGDSKRDAMLKIAAGLLNVGVDELKRRDAQRRARLWSMVAFGSLVIAALTVGLALYAFGARREAEIRRAQAEALIGYMLGDLRKKLEPIGKLELLDSIGDQAMAYFAAIGEKGSEKEMLERARALKQVGDVRFNQGELEPALVAFQQALAQTRALHEASPGNNDYLFELGQAEFWVGYVAWQRGNLENAYQSMLRYMECSRELSERAPENADYLLELGYAYGNLGSMTLAQDRPELALSNFRVALAIVEPMLAKAPGNYDLASTVADQRSWVGSTLLDLGRLGESRDEFARAVAVMRPFHVAAQDKRASYDYARMLLLQSESDIERGEIDEARRALEESRAIYRKLLEFDPGNATWSYSALKVETHLLSLVPPDEWTAKEHLELARVESRLGQSFTRDFSDKDYLRSVFHIRVLRDVLLLHQDDAGAALRAAEQTWTELQEAMRGKTMVGGLVLLQARAAESLGSAHAAAGNAARAREIWHVEADRLDATSARDLSLLAVRRLLAIDLGQTALAQDIEARLARAGYRDPRMDPAYTRSGAFQ
jgi:tetratricopeptide (TPR) repeat protein